MHLYSDLLLLPYPHEGWTTGYPYIPQQLAYDTTDSEYLYQANLRRQPDSWHYRTHEVTYTWNSNGYRASAWADTDWASSWIVLGCSHVAGIGLAYEDTVSEQLARQLGEPCVNLGMGGATMDIILYNTLRLIDQGIKPRGVIIVTPELARLTLWRDTDYVNLNPAFKAYDPYVANAYHAWLRYEPNAELHSYVKLRACISLWSQQAIEPYVAYVRSAQDPTHNIGLHLPPHQDFARDVDVINGRMWGHFGRATIASWARALAEVIQNT